jgi:acrylyl-CoA reductase (NADPH)
MTGTFTAIVLDNVDGRPKASFSELTLADLPDHDVLVQVEYS